MNNNSADDDRHPFNSLFSRTA